MHACGRIPRGIGTGIAGVGAKRLAYIETMRGLACILLVSWHIVGERVTDGLNLPLDHPLHLLGEFFLPLRMPLFAFISGYVFNAFIEDLGVARETIAVKARRLLLPLIFVGTLHFIVRSAAYGYPLSGLWRVYLGSYEHFWYLQATFVIMSGLAVVSALYQGRALLAASVCLAVAAPLYVFEMNLHPVNWFSITKVFYIAPFFLLGQVLRTAQFEEHVTAMGPARWRLLAALGAVIVVLVWMRQSGIAPFGLPFNLHSAPMLILSGALCVFLFTLRWENKYLAMIGPYSYAIYLFHVIFTAGFRYFETQIVHEHSPYIIWGLSLVVGVAAPIVTARALRLGPPILETLFLGVRLRRAPKHAPAAANA